MLLGVNIDHIATLRQARYRTMLDSPNAEPSPLTGALDAKAGGADSITLHVRGDRRHIQESDAFAIRRECDLPLNLEMGNTQELIDIALELKPEFVCLVPEKREEISTEGGLDVITHEESLKPTLSTLQEAGIKISLFIDPVAEHVEMSRKLGAEMIELHTGCFANAQGEEQDAEVQRLTEAAILGHSLGLQVNAGHGINYTNIEKLYTVPHLTELNIGHSIVARSVRVGFQNAVREMRDLLNLYPS